MTNHFSHYDDTTREDAPLDDTAAAGEATEETAAGEAQQQPRAVRTPRRRGDDEESGAGTRPSKPRKSSRTGNGSRVTAREENVVHLAHPAADARSAEGQAEDDEAEALRQLASQGFSPDEAVRIINLSERLANSRDAREAEAAMRRLRFTRWLVERGVLDEFSA